MGVIDGVPMGSAMIAIDFALVSALDRGV